VPTAGGSLLVLGIDPGISATGYGLIEARGPDLHFRDAGVFRSPTSLSMQRRLRRLCVQLEEFLQGCDPPQVAMETIFQGRNVRSALTMAHVRGAYLLSLENRGLAVREYAPTEVKKALTGHGQAAKEQVREMVLRLLKRTQLPPSLDASDALAIAICHAQVSRFESNARICSA
jgi:crossover junction endodeoxyribonuclease RuvC